VSAVALDRPGARRREPGNREADHPGPSLFDDLGGEPTLDEVLSRAWEGLAAHQHVACPVCGGGMSPSYGAHALPIGGSCGSCGTQLT
jgi:hypothetical protein